MSHNRDDAYHQDAAGRSLAGLEIIIQLEGIKPDLLKGVLECLQKGNVFILHNDEALALFDPNDLTVIEKPAEMRVHYIDKQQFLNGVKLALLAYTELIVLKVGIASPAEAKQIKKPPM